MEDLAEQLLDKRADANIQDVNGNSVLFVAAEAGMTSAVSKLVQAQVRSRQPRVSSNRLSLTLRRQLNAARLGAVGTAFGSALRLLNKTVNKEGRTAAHVAAQGGHLEILKLLIQCWPDSVSDVDSVRSAPRATVRLSVLSRRYALAVRPHAAFAGRAVRPTRGRVVPAGAELHGGREEGSSLLPSR
jgi:hypothetical protein